MKEVKVTLPRNLGDITLGQYQKYEQLLAENAGAEQERFMQLKMIEIFCGVKFEEAQKMKMVVFSEVIESLYATLNEKPKLVQSFYLGDTEFAFIPDLENMTFGEYVDLEQFIGDIKDLHKAIAVLYRPVKQRVKEKYLIYDYEGDMYHETMKNAPMDACASAMLFFWTLGIDCLTVILKSSKLKQKDKEAINLLQQQKVLAKNGVGSVRYLNSLTTILQDLNQSQNLE